MSERALFLPERQPTSLQERWSEEERLSLRELLTEGVFDQVYPPFAGPLDRFSLHAPQLFPFSHVAEFTGAESPGRSFDVQDLRLGRVSSLAQLEVALEDFALQETAQPASFRHLLQLSDWKVFAGRTGSVPRLLLPGVVYRHQGQELFPVIDYILPQDRASAWPGFVLRARPLAALLPTGARALFVRAIMPHDPERV